MADTEYDDDNELDDLLDDQDELEDDVDDDSDNDGDDEVDLPGGDDEVDEVEPRTYDEAYVKKLRRENAKARRDSKAALRHAAEEAAENARLDFARDLFGALGLDEDDEPDPEEAIAFAQNQSREATRKLKNYQVKDAVASAAREHSADVDLLAPYLRGKGLLDDIDPDDEDFVDLIDEIVEQAVARNPKLKAEAPTPRRSGGDMSGGPAEKGGKSPKTIDDYRAALRKHREKRFGVSY